MADTVLSYTIPEAKVDEYVADYCYVHKNTETKDDPEWEDPQDGTTAPQVAKYPNDAAWVREHILRQIKSQIVRGKKAQYRDAEGVSDVSDVT